jgi:hypothetical protein
MPAILPSCHALSSRDANREITGGFLHETISTCPQAGLVIHKTPVFAGKKCGGFLFSRGFFWRATGSSSNGLRAEDIFSQTPVADSVHVGKNIADNWN